MAKRTITIELLRDGPPHNQLLSPLTVYLAKVQNRPAESIRLTIEHGNFLRWQAGLTYASGRGTSRLAGALSEAEERATSAVERRGAIADASQAVTNLLGSIRALIAELSSEPCEWRHVHLVTDASELGALPFELARAAPGLMVEGERLFVQQNARVTLTRQTHRVATSVVRWPSRPRILCIVADGGLPSDSHVLALLQAIDPWIGWNDGERRPGEGDSAAPPIDGLAQEELEKRLEEDREKRLDENRVREAEQMLTVLENPTLAEVSERVSRTCFTHVHVLAHGAPLPHAGPSQTLYGLAFRGPDGRVDVVDGDRLEAALRAPGDCNHPTVVTLATCEGGNLSGGILGPGGSAAHALHSKGIPLVMASQFPLSKGASVIATEMLYRRLLRGEDPRVALHAIRRELIVSHPDTHDWASLVMYASLPDDLEAQLLRVKKESDKLAAEAAVERLRVSLWGPRRSEILLGDLDADEHVAVRDRVALDVDRLDRTVAAVRAWTRPENDVATRVWAHRILARVCLRLWEVYAVPWRPWGMTVPSSTWMPIKLSISSHLGRQIKHDPTSGERPISMYDPVDLLKLAKDSYETAFHLDPSRSEIWVQVVALCWARGVDQFEQANFARDLNATQHMGWLLAERVSKGNAVSRDERALAAAVDFEAALLVYLHSRSPGAEPPGGTRAAGPGDPWTQQSPTGSSPSTGVEKAFERFLAAASPIAESYRAHAAWRHLRRYAEWAKVVISDARVQNEAIGLIEKYILALETQGVRRYWGPRTRA